MSFPAARITSMTMHGGVVNLGSPLTLIGGMPASRIGDIHACPFVTVLVPHATGPIVLGAFNVLVGGPPQARMLDMAICVGPPSMVMLGHFTTLVGMAGAFAGGIGGALGLIVGGLLAGLKNFESGYPKAVKCPKDAKNPSGYKTQYSKSITIEGTPEFQAQTCKDLDTVASTKAGQNTLNRIENSGKSVTIRETSGGNACSFDPSKAFQSSGGAKGAGSDSIVDYNPNRTQIGDGSEPWMKRPPDVGLEHELKHSADAADGKMIPGSTVIDGRATKNNEAQAVGLGSSASDPGTENAYRAERGLPPRTYY